MELLDLGNYPEIFADGIGDVFAVGKMAHVLLFRWHKIDGIFRRTVAGEVIRPVGSITEEQLAKWGSLFKIEGARSMLH